LLLVLHTQPAHGYTLIGELRRFNLADVNPSAIYRVLRDMEAKGWVTSTWDATQTQGPPRRVYQLTASGDEVLTWWMRDLQETYGLIGDLMDAYNQHMEAGQGDYH
jgi:DNA-binding PadR family transcriptional regulator